MVPGPHRRGRLSTALVRLHGKRSPEAVVRSLAGALQARFRQAGPPFNPFLYAEKLRLPIQYGPIEAEGVLADWPSPNRRIILRDGDTRVSQPKARRERFTLAHELGHFVLREELREEVPISCFRLDDPEEEYLCNTFAEELLMPRENFLPDIQLFGLTPRSTLRLCDRYDVSLQALLTRAHITAAIKPDRARPNGSGLMTVLWTKRNARYVVEWASPARFREMLLCNTGHTSVERAFATDSEQNGRDYFILDGKYLWWQCTSLRLTESKVLMVGLRSWVSSRLGDRPSRESSATVKKEVRTRRDELLEISATEATTCVELKAAKPSHQLALPFWTAEPQLAAARKGRIGGPGRKPADRHDS